MEERKLERFRELQLMTRDGLLGAADHEHMKRTMDLSTMPPARQAEFLDAGVYSLVTTQEKRDAANWTATTALLESGAPGICLTAVHHPASSPIASADDDDIGLARELIVVRGSRVMVTWNISVSHGLVNGTVGNVVDVLVQRGVPTSILIAVRRASKTGTATRDHRFAILRSMTSTTQARNHRYRAQDSKTPRQQARLLSVSVPHHARSRRHGSQGAGFDSRESSHRRRDRRAFGRPAIRCTDQGEAS